MVTGAGGEVILCVSHGIPPQFVAVVLGRVVKVGDLSVLLHHQPVLSAGLLLYPLKSPDLGLLCLQLLKEASLASLQRGHVVILSLPSHLLLLQLQPLQLSSGLLLCRVHICTRSQVHSVTQCSNQ